ncbi:hypothetical protein BIW11_05923 [Tropilaelaps mercedesae]|uniref:Transmembrane inner ear expressed protein-like n=1 Tax=Tropilaelaps mercedesae TaxID=418985 RepID=A0A1V9Y0E9_9ACAR|nr:hypothetical protein BIW11_05923 [Tropilaelaps mercedesae]
MAECVAVVPEVGSDWLEKSVIAGFRVWQLMFMSCAGATVIIVVMCCFMKCRVPRTKQEIEADCHRRELTLQFRKQLNRITMDDMTFLKALDKVRVAFEDEEEKRQRGSWDSLLEQEGKDFSLKLKLRKLLRIFRFKKKKKDKDGGKENGTTEAEEAGKPSSTTNHHHKEGSNSTAGEGFKGVKASPEGENSSEGTYKTNDGEHQKDCKNRDHFKKDHVEIDLDSDVDGSSQHKD